MYNFLVKKGTTLAFIVGTLIIAIFLGTALSGLSGAGYDTSTDLVGMGKEAVAQMDFFDTGIWLTILLIAFSILLMLLFGILGIIKFPKAGMKSLAAFVGLIVLFFILKSIAPIDVSEKMVKLKDEFNISDGVSGIIGGGILTTLVLSGIAIAAMVFFEIRNAFK